MLAKLKLLRQEDKALEEIEARLRAQLNRLKQEEHVLRRLMRDPHGEEETRMQGSVGLNKESDRQIHVDDDEMMNKEPLMDLNAQATSILQMCQAQYQVEQHMLSEEEEEKDEEEEEEEKDEEEEEDEQEDDQEHARGMQMGDYHENNANDRTEDSVGAEYSAELRDLLQQMRSEVDHEEEDLDEDNSDYDDT